MESLVARRARWRADDRQPRERAEPRIGAATHDADIQDVVQKFELVYSQFSADQRERGQDQELPEAAAAAFGARRTSPPRDRTEGRSDTIEAAFRMGATAVPVAAETPIEKFELPEEPVLQITERRPALSAWRESERQPGRVWPKVLGGAGLALVIGIGVGYVMVPRADSPSARTKIESSAQGGTRLRMDYELQTR
jgi:hypothetical protein